MRAVVTKNGIPYAREDGGQALEKEEVHGMDITSVEETNLLRAFDDLESLGAPHLSWTDECGSKWRIERALE